MIEIIQDEEGMRVVVEQGFAKGLGPGETLHCPECGERAWCIVAHFSASPVQPLWSFELLGCGHQFRAREWTLTSRATESRTDYELARNPT